MTRLRSRAASAAALLVLVLALAACSGGAGTDVQVLPHEGTWQLVRVNRQPLPVRLDSVEVVGEEVRFLLEGSGFVREVARRFSGGAASTGVNTRCESWFGYQIIAGQITTGAAANQPPSGACPSGIERRMYTLQGDTLRSNGGTGFSLAGVPYAYVRIRTE